MNCSLEERPGCADLDQVFYKKSALYLTGEEEPEWVRSSVGGERQLDKLLDTKSEGEKVTLAEHEERKGSSDLNEL